MIYKYGKQFCFAPWFNYPIVRKKVLPKMELENVTKNLGKILHYSKKKVLPKMELENVTKNLGTHNIFLLVYA